MNTPPNSAGPSRRPEVRDIGQLYREHREAVLSYVGQRVRGSDVEDLTQEVFRKAERGLAAFRGDASVRTWLLRIAARAVLDHVRSRRFREDRRTDALADVQTGGEAAATCLPEALCEPAKAPAAMVRQEMHSCVREFVDRLPPPYREVILLREIENLSSGEMAARLGVGVEAAKIRLHRARRALRELLETGCELYPTESHGVGCDRLSPLRTNAVFAAHRLGGGQRPATR